MITADKKALKATLNQGISNILGELVNLYSSNLSDIGVQSAVIAGLAFAGSVATNFPDSEYTTFISGISGAYYVILFIAFTTAVISVVITTISAAFGPSLALTGEDSKTILYAIRQMQETQEYAFLLAGISVITMVLSLAFYSLATFPLGPAIMTFVASIVGIVLLFKRGLSILQNVRQKGKRYLEQILSTFQDSQSDAVIGSKESISRVIQHPNITYVSYIWKRKEMHDGGAWQYLYAVLSKGGIDIYASKNAYNDGSDRLKRISLKFMKVSTDPKYFNPETTQISLSLFSQTYVKDRKLMFVLLPLNEHEIINSVNSVEFQAESFESFKQWMKVLKIVEDFYSSFRGNALKSVLESG